MVAVERLEPDVVEVVVVLPHQPLAPVVILPNPFLEPLLDLLLLLACAFGRFARASAAPANHSRLTPQPFPIPRC
jgi:hypothetical protein